MCDWLCVIASQSGQPHAVAKGSGERERSDCVWSCENRITKLDAATHKFAQLFVLCYIAAISNRNRKFASICCGKEFDFPPLFCSLPYFSIVGAVGAPENKVRKNYNEIEVGYKNRLAYRLWFPIEIALKKAN